VEGVTVARNIGTWRLPTRSGLLQVVALPWLTHSSLMSRDERKGCNLEQLNAMLLRKIAPALEEQFNALDPSLPAVLVGHATVEGATFGSERGVLLGWDLVVPRSLLAHAGLQYVALGHLHRHQVLSDHPPMVYSGSIERVDFGEEGEQKGFVEVEIQAGSPATFRFIPVPARPFVSIEVRVDQGDPTGAVLEAVAARDVAGAVVRVIVRGSTSVRLREADVRKELEKASYVSGITQETERTARLRLWRDAGETLTPERALESYLTAKEVGEERRKVLITYARKLMAGASPGPGGGEMP
jgi:exonuclease SbcD